MRRGSPKRLALGFALLLLGPPALGSNTPIDTDGNGEPDYVSVSDWDNDGTLEMVDDIRAAIASLTDAGPKVVVVEPGSYVSPPTVQGHHILRLPSNLELVGFGAGVSILNGFDATNVTAVGAVVVNADFALGNENITIRDLEINGGWGSGDAGGLAHLRMGVFFNKCTNCRVESTTVRDTLHTCLYSKNGTDVHFDGNTLLRCGNYSGSGGARYPCVYLFADDGLSQENVYVTDNSCSRPGAGAMNTRREDPASFLRNIHFDGNTIEDTRIEVGYARRCFIVSGIDGGFYTNNSCTRTGSFFYYSEAYYSDESYAAASRDIHVDNLSILDPSISPGLEIHGYLEQATFRNIEVRHVDLERDCLVFDQPFRDVAFEDIVLDDCGRMGIYESSATPLPLAAEEGLTFRRVSVSGVDGDRLDGLDRPAVSLRTARNLTIDSMTITDVAGDGIFISGDLTDSLLRNNDMTDVGGSGIALGPGAVLDGVAISGNSVERAGAKGIDLQLHSTLPSQTLDVSENTIRDFGRAAPGASSAVGIEVSGAVVGLAVRDNQIEDLDDQALFGLVYDVSPAPADPSGLCTNRFSGTLAPSECYFVTGAVNQYQDDQDGDNSVEACDCAPADPVSYPDAPETNDGLDNQCPGDHGYGIIDETSGDSGFHNSSAISVYSWIAQSGATGYQVARANVPELAVSCATLSTTSGPQWTDPAVPAPGNVFYYFNRPLAPNVGNWGASSAGVERKVACP